MKDSDRGFKKRVALLKDLGKAEITVGIHSQEGGQPSKKSPGQTVLEIGTYNEFGLGVPERSFIRAWFDENEAFAEKAISLLMRQAADGKITKEQALERLGQRFVGGIQKRIADGIEPPNAKRTIDKKGSSTPLIDTGQLRSSITYRINDPSSK